jgi:hypothetical protein
MAILEASRKKDYNDKKFAASIQGLDLDESVENESSSDVTSLQGWKAQEEGFGIGEGLALMTLEA